MLPLGTTVRSAAVIAWRNSWYASAGSIVSGATIVNLAPVDTMRGSNVKFLHVKPITQTIRSLSSLSDLNVLATRADCFLQANSGAAAGADCANAGAASATVAASARLCATRVFIGWST